MDVEEPVVEYWRGPTVAFYIPPSRTRFALLGGAVWMVVVSMFIWSLLHDHRPMSAGLRLIASGFLVILAIPIAAWTQSKPSSRLYRWISATSDGLVVRSNAAQVTVPWSTISQVERGFGMVYAVTGADTFFHGPNNPSMTLAAVSIPGGGLFRRRQRITELYEQIEHRLATVRARSEDAPTDDPRAFVLSPSESGRGCQALQPHPFLAWVVSVAFMGSFMLSSQIRYGEDVFFGVFFGIIVLQLCGVPFWKDDPAREPTKVERTRDGLLVTTMDGVRRVAWSDIARVRWLDGLIAIKVSKQPAVVIPTRAFSDLGAAEQFAKDVRTGFTSVVASDIAPGGPAR